MDPRARAVGHQLGLPTEAEEAEPNTLTEVSALMEYEETGDGIRKIMRESDIGWPSTDEDAASSDAHDRDLTAIEKLDNKLTRHPATSLLVQHAALMVALVEWWHVRLCARLAHGLPALAKRSAPLPTCLMAIVGSYCGWERCRECSRLSTHL